MRPYSIFLPDFDITSGGIRVMWGLYGHLLAKGHIIHPNVTYHHPDFVAIYPEIVNGNPLGAKHVVRYILNKPGVMSGNGIPGPTIFDPSDQLFYFSKLFGEGQSDHYMFLPILNSRLFYDQRKKRTKTAYFIGKGLSFMKPLLPGEEPHDFRFIHPQDAVLIDRPFAQDQQALADLLNECEVLYVYDPVTAMTELARLCGCRIVMVNPVYSKDEFKKYEPGMNGISWGKDEGVQLEVKGFREHYAAMKMQFFKRLEHFIDLTQR